MITNKRSGIYLIPVLLFTIMGPGCSMFKKEPEPPVQEYTPPPEERAPETVSAATETPMPQATPIRTGAPERYTVKKGDTLWDIARHFLNDPWLWPEVWHINQAIRNPHLIYPGDVITLAWVEGRPVLTLEGAEAVPPSMARPDLPTVKLSPQARVEALDKAITTLPKEVIGPFLYRPFIVSEHELDKAPYVVGNYGNKVIAGEGDRLYVRRLGAGEAVNFHVVRKGVPYVDPDTNEILGYEAINLGEVRLVRLGDPTTFTVTKAYKEILKGDYLIPEEVEVVDMNFFPRAPERSVAGRIISVADGVAKIGQYNVVVINKGMDQGLEPGHVLEIHQAGDIVRDPYSRSRVRLPEERAGYMMIFRPYERVSYALVMEAFRELKIHDYVYSP